MRVSGFPHPTFIPNARRKRGSHQQGHSLRKDATHETVNQVGGILLSDIIEQRCFAVRVEQTGLRCQIAEYILVYPSVMRALVSTPCANRSIEGPALFYIRSSVVFILGDFARVGSLDRVAPIRPGAE